MSRRDRIEFAVLTFFCGVSALATAGSVYIRNTTDEDGNPRPKISLHEPLSSLRGDNSNSSFFGRFGLGENGGDGGKRK